MALPMTDIAHITPQVDYIMMFSFRYELNDRLNRLGWTMRGYSVTDGERGMVHSEMWFKELLY